MNWLFSSVPPTYVESYLSTSKRNGPLMAGTAFETYLLGHIVQWVELRVKVWYKTVGGKSSKSNNANGASVRWHVGVLSKGVLKGNIRYEYTQASCDLWCRYYDLSQSCHLTFLIKPRHNSGNNLRFSQIERELALFAVATMTSFAYALLILIMESAIWSTPLLILVVVALFRAMK